MKVGQGGEEKTEKGRHGDVGDRHDAQLSGGGESSARVREVRQDCCYLKRRVPEKNPVVLSKALARWDQEPSRVQASLAGQFCAGCAVAKTPRESSKRMEILGC